MNEKPPTIEKEMTKEEELKALEKMKLKMKALKEKDKAPDNVDYEKPPK